MSRESRQGLTLISPPFLYAILMLAAPMVMVVTFSFWTQNYLDLDRTPTFANYREAWTGEIFRVLMLRSLMISFFVTIVTVLLAFPIAYFLSFHVKRQKALWLFLITSRSTTCWDFPVEGDPRLQRRAELSARGWVDQRAAGLLPGVPAMSSRWRMGAFAILPIFVALERIDRSLLEAAEAWRRPSTAVPW